MARDVIYCSLKDRFEQLIRDNKRLFVYSLRDLKKSVITNDAIYKDISGFGNIDLAYDALDLWKAANLNGAPSCMASFYHSVVCNPKVSYSQNILFVDKLRGAWIETFKRGVIEGWLSYYDIISAYYWAGTQGVPIRIYPYNRQFKHYLVIVRVNDAELPTVLKGKLSVLTSEDIGAYNIDCTILCGVGWNDSDVVSLEYDFNRVIEHFRIDNENMIKQMRRSYWGLWASNYPLVYEEYENGSMIRYKEQRNARLNMIWSFIIVHRVIQRLWIERNGAILVLTDAILTKNNIKTGNNIGDWKLLGRYNGVKIDSPAVWTQFPYQLDKSQWVKHSGYKRG